MFFIFRYFDQELQTACAEGQYIGGVVATGVYHSSASLLASSIFWGEEALRF